MSLSPRLFRRSVALDDKVKISPSELFLPQETTVSSDESGNEIPSLINDVAADSVSQMQDDHCPVVGASTTSPCGVPGCYTNSLFVSSLEKKTSEQRHTLSIPTSDASWLRALPRMYALSALPLIQDSCLRRTAFTTSVCRVSGVRYACVIFVVNRCKYMCDVTK